MIKELFKDILRQKNIYGLMIINLVIGFFGFFVVYFFQSSLKADLYSKSKNLLAADVSIVASRVFSKQDIEKYEKEISYVKKAEIFDFFAMISSNDQQRLVNVRAVSDDFPLYGNIKTTGLPLSDGKNNDIINELIWIDPEVKDQLNLSEKAQIKLGESVFTLAGVIEDDSTRFFRSGGLAPVVYISEKYLSETQLIKSGSTVRHRLLYQLKANQNTEELKAQFELKIKDNTVKFETSSDKAEDSQITFKYFTDYLGLVALMTVLLSLVILYYLVHWNFNKETKNLSIYKILGMTNQRLLKRFMIQQVFVTVLAYLVAIGFVYLFKVPIDLALVKYGIPFGFKITLYDTVVLFVFIIILSLLVGVTLIERVQRLDIKNVFNQNGTSVVIKMSKIHLILWVLGLFLISFIQTKSYKAASSFTLGVIAIVALLYFIYTLSLQALNKVHFNRWNLSYFVKATTYYKSATFLAFTIIVFAVAILTLLPTVKNSIYQEIKPETQSVLPALFAFDIQSHQIQPFLDLARHYKYKDINPYPMIRARILKINEDDFSKSKSDVAIMTREQEEEMRFKNRGVNLTYRKDLGFSEKITEGRWFKDRYEGAGDPEISLEKKYAERLNIKIGDKLTFDIQGLEITAKVTSFRQVRWTTFQPNFFIVFQTGVLEEAPQNYIVSLPQNLEAAQFQSATVKNWSNISIIDIKQTVVTVLKYIDQMSIALMLMAALSLILGAFILFIIINTQIIEREKEVILLKSLGAPLSLIRNGFLQQFLLIVVYCFCVGSLIGFAISGLIVNQVFKIDVYLDYYTWTFTFIVVIAMSSILLYFNLKKINSIKVLDILRSA